MKKIILVFVMFIAVIINSFAYNTYGSYHYSQNEVGYHSIAITLNCQNYCIGTLAANEPGYVMVEAIKPSGDTVTESIYYTQTSGLNNKSINWRFPIAGCYVYVSMTAIVSMYKSNGLSLSWQ
jgi:hypothetical protein